MISVCMATHNGEKYIKEQLVSILYQLGPNDEVVISDDGSTDNTLNIIKQINDKRIRVYILKNTDNTRRVHWYVAKNFENALKYANGDIIFLSDQDDVWMPNKVIACLEALKSNDIVLHNLQCVDSELKPLNKNVYHNNFRRKNYLMRHGLHYGCGLAFKKELLKYILPFPKNLVIHDYWIGIVGESVGKLAYIDTPLAKYRIHSLNTSGSSHYKNSIAYKIYYRLYTILSLIKRLRK